ncbi:MtrB/PioB family decaheme-associated outer membrane protein [Ferrimonas lipolytica]|uniref:MtrB/PioB family decaheme-associated outer membrane protein n=1 Tax=Ferrimonas lipolytica TaxID=2724191 RepID=A0A6H1UJ62_9GAMM|nr:MtrB/PioB family decaheme-associated outer membrane protein [Ferrimonas lipolytica]QIZ78256.1 MtrB/PioB family decaheme-associated outer membrane protein [Ferrimonas lipolytica]
MKMKLSLVALAMLNVGALQAASFNLNQANTANLNTDKWACKRCDTNHDSGSVGVSLLSVDADDARAANRSGDEDGTAAALQADLVSQNNGDRIQLHATDFGLETGRVDGRFDNDQFGVHAGYQSNLQVSSDKAQTMYGINQGVIINSGNLNGETLETKREKWLLGGELKGDFWRGFVEYRNEDKSGQQVKSSQFIGLPSGDSSGLPINYVAPIDHNTQTLVAGGELMGERWLAGVKYQGSQFDNDHNGIDAMSGGSIQAYEPENESHQVIVNGQYRFERDIVSGRIVKGWMSQDQDFVSTAGVPAGIHSADAEVETLDINARWNHRASADLRIKTKIDYRDRDNKTPIRLYQSLDYDANKGRAVENVAMDSERLAYQVAADYRLAKGIKFNGGYQGIDKEQTDSVKEETKEDRFFAGVRYDRLTQWDLSLDAEFSRRDGSDYQADEATSDEDNAVLRKYHLADRDRQQLRFGASHTPLDNLSVDLNVRYALDDYSDTDLGLKESRDSSFDLSVNYQPLPQLSLHLFAGQQWIDSQQSDRNSSSRYGTDSNDTFSHAGFGGRYHGLLQDKLVIGLDYGFNESESETEISGNNLYGDYIAWSHNVDVYAEYQLSANTKVKASYGYERYYDTDYGSVASSSYTTLGEMDSNYVAHTVMLTFSYAL